MPNRKTVTQKILKRYKKLSTKKGRLEAGAFLVEGVRAIKQVMHSCPDEIMEILTIKETPPVFKNYPTRLLTGSQFRSLSLTTTPQGVMAIVRHPMDIYTNRLPDNTGSKILLLEDIQDPGNVGTLIRTASAFDLSGVIMSEKCADPLSPKSVQSTAGSVLSVWIRKTARYLDLAVALKKRGYSFITADINGVDQPFILDSKEKFLLALGNEASGPSKQLIDATDLRLRIPINRQKAESLNVAASGAIFMYLSSSKT